jgi:hypothetical protein
MLAYLPAFGEIWPGQPHSIVAHTTGEKYCLALKIEYNYKLTGALIDTVEKKLKSSVEGNWSFGKVVLSFPDLSPEKYVYKEFPLTRTNADDEQQTQFKSEVAPSDLSDIDDECNAEVSGINPVMDWALHEEGRYHTRRISDLTNDFVHKFIYPGQICIGENATSAIRYAKAHRLRIRKNNICPEGGLQVPDGTEEIFQRDLIKSGIFLNGYQHRLGAGQSYSITLVNKKITTQMPTVQSLNTVIPPQRKRLEEALTNFFKSNRVTVKQVAPCHSVCTALTIQGKTSDNDSLFSHSKTGLDQNLAINLKVSFSVSFLGDESTAGNYREDIDIEIMSSGFSPIPQGYRGSMDSLRFTPYKDSEEEVDRVEDVLARVISSELAKHFEGIL